MGAGPEIVCDQCADRANVGAVRGDALDESLTVRADLHGSVHRAASASAGGDSGGGCGVEVYALHPAGLLPRCAALEKSPAGFLQTSR